MNIKIVEHLKTYYSPFRPQHVTGRMSAKVDDTSPKIRKPNTSQIKHENFLAEVEYFSAIKVMITCYVIEYETSVLRQKKNYLRVRMRLVMEKSSLQLLNMLTKAFLIIR